MSDHWLMLEGPKEVAGVAKVTFDAWATKYYTRPKDGALAVTDDPNELKRLLESALASAHVHAQPQIPHGRPPTQREEYKITINFSNGRYLGKTLEQVGRMDHEGAAFLRWLAGYGSQPFSWHNTVDYVLLAQSFERLTKRAVAFETRGDGSSWIAKWKDGSRPPSAAPSLAPSSVGDGEVGRGEDSGDDERDDDDDAPEAVHLPSKLPAYRMNQVQFREWEKVRDGVVPNMYGNKKMNDVGFWSQQYIDPVDPTQEVLASASYDELGFCSYKAFASTAAELIYSILDPAAQVERFEAIVSLQSGGTDFDVVHGHGAGDMPAVLMQEFMAADAEGTGTLSMKQVQEVLAGCALGLSAEEVAALMSAAEKDASGAVVYNSLTEYAFFVLQYLAQSAAL